ncbi:hypothetical protein Tco_0824966, partial [Tanacetum coccineum]
ELVNRRVAEEMEAREAAMNLEPMNENKDEQEGGNGGNGGNKNGGNGGNGNGGNGNRGNGENGNVGNGHRNGNHGMNYGGFMPVARECTFQDFLKCKPQNFLGTEGVVGLTHWFEKMETVFNINMAIQFSSISSESSEKRGDTCGRVILIETPIITPTIPPSPDYTPASPDYSPASLTKSDPSEDPSSDHIPPLPAISPFYYQPI